MNSGARVGLRVMAGAAFLTVAGYGSANECLLDADTHNAYQVGKPSSWAIAKQQARKTWDDWIWEGPIFLCTATEGLMCTYSWSKSHQQGYEWSVNLGVDPGSIPMIGGALKAFDAGGSYTRVNYYTETFQWTQQIGPEYYAQPVQVVVRRWKSGVFQGMDQRTGSTCPYGKTGANAHQYWWNGSATYGSWSGNNEESRHGMYYVHK